MTAPVVPPKPSAWWEDLLEIFVSPGAVFARRKESSFIVPMAVLTILLVGLYYLTLPALESVFDAEFRKSMAKAMEKNPQITAEQMQQSLATTKTFGGLVALVVLPLSMLLIGTVLWGVSRLVEAKTTLKTAILVATLSYFPRIIESVTNALQGLLLPEGKLTSRAAISLGPARFLDPATASPILLALTQRLDLFTLWVTVLLAIGLRVTGQVSGAQAAGVAAIVWLLGALPQLVGALAA